MHELAVTENLLELALRHAERAGAKKILALHLTIGELSSVVDDSVQFYWDLISRDTLAEGAELVFHRVPANLVCRMCGQSFGLDGETLACPTCQSVRVLITQGEEFTLDAIDVETDADMVGAQR